MQGTTAFLISTFWVTYTHSCSKFGYKSHKNNEENPKSNAAAPCTLLSCITYSKIKLILQIFAPQTVYKFQAGAEWLQANYCKQEYIQ